ncbi:MAG: UvrD-helicase domain-containing protein [Lachnospiraceae bacterium]|nr:UvrD-helicase domain-containing protein [Lachnospiraceae bacterium]
MYIADLHIHSRYSRATSRDLTPEQLDVWAGRKGIDIVGTGDFTHPAWRQELRDSLIPAEDGLYRLKEEARLTDPIAGGRHPRFVISGEISSIYKKNGRTRKVHSLILLPGLEEAERLSVRLEAIGNIHSDGRPILGLDCRDLLEITLEVCPRAIFVPAHIWTPHFSVFGAFSGFDTMEECFEDLTPYIHAVETGLSSDPPMNWRLSALDRYQLISNSDAHSPAKLGREANLLSTPLSYSGLYDAIQTGQGLEGTIEFFPEEGKYHCDGHRKCNVCLTPAQADAYSGLCPVCKKKLTIGVSHRVEQLADREEGAVRPNAKPYESLAPLQEVIASCTGLSAASTKVQQKYEAMLGALGSEFSILREVPLADVRRGFGEAMAEGIRRLRAGEVKRIPGYDGEYGIIRLLEPWEAEELNGQMSLFAMMDSAPGTLTEKQGRAPEDGSSPENGGGSAGGGASDGGTSSEPGREAGLNPEQRRAAMQEARTVAVIAGPGTGKTRTLIARIEYLMEEKRVKPGYITAVTFTNRAASELKERIGRSPEGKRRAKQLQVGTFHSICRSFLKEQGYSYVLADESETLEFAENTRKEFGLKLTPSQLLRKISRRKAGCSNSEAIWNVPEEAYLHYQNQLAARNALDYDDLLLKTLAILKEGPGKCAKEETNPAAGQNSERKARKPKTAELERLRRFTYLLVDEFQDCSPVQYELIKAWNAYGAELFVIGDPDQAIYGFRGADARCFERLLCDYPQSAVIRLKEQYRSTPEIVSAAVSVIGRNPGGERMLEPKKESGLPVRVVTAGSETAEAIFAAKEITRLIGGIDMLDAQEREPGSRETGFGDIAILYRTNRQASVLETCLQKEGIPYVVAGKDDFLTEEKVRGTICFFRAVLAPEDTAAAELCKKLLWKLEKTVIADTVFAETKAQYEERIAKEKPHKLLERFLKEQGLSEQEGLKKLLGMSRFYKTMPEFLEALALGGEADLRRCGGKAYTADAVTLSTLHASKGLEYPVVMLCGVREGMLPLQNVRGDADPEEERRLFYVGMTRAERELILVTSGEPSEYLLELPENGVLREDASKKRAVQKEEQLSLFDFMAE